MSRSRIVPLALLLSVSAFALAGCTAPGAEPTATPSADPLTVIPAITPDKDLAAEVPADVKAAGLTIASSADTPPLTYFADDNQTIIGFDVDMSHAIGEVLDLKTEIANVGFDTIIPGLAAKRFDFALSSIGVTAERQETVDFVSYYHGGQGFLASTRDSETVTTFNDLCGQRVAVSKGTVQESTLEDAATLCADAGLDPWELQVYPDSNAAVLAIKSDRSDVMYASISIVGYTAAHTDGFRIAGVYKRTTVGVAFPKGSALAPLVQKAIQDLIDSGVYQQILDKWGLGDNAIEAPEFNSAS